MSGFLMEGGLPLLLLLLLLMPGGMGLFGEVSRPDAGGEDMVV